MLLSSWERGLKFISSILELNRSKSLSSWERGLKSYNLGRNAYASNPSLSSWERGLKYQRPVLQKYSNQSLSSWERGLKSDGWIRGKSLDWGRSLRESVDWNTSILYHRWSVSLSLSSWERGLKFWHQRGRSDEEWRSLSSWERGLKFFRVY